MIIGEYEYPRAGWWNLKESIAENMTNYELEFARKDCYEAAKANPANEGKYYDEGSIYARELAKRKSK